MGLSPIMPAIFPCFELSRRFQSGSSEAEQRSYKATVEFSKYSRTTNNGAGLRAQSGILYTDPLAPPSMRR